jgi:hypothetical protein
VWKVDNGTDALSRLCPAVLLEEEHPVKIMFSGKEQFEECEERPDAANCPLIVFSTRHLKDF